jgi:hypothetical protein
MPRLLPTAAALVALALGVLALPAAADVVDNDIVMVTPGAADRVSVPLGGSTVVHYRLLARTGGSDPVAGCNASTATPATVQVNAPPGVTAMPSTFDFTGCHNVDGTQVPVTFTADDYPYFSGSGFNPRGHLIRVSVLSGPGLYQTAPATFRLAVTLDFRGFHGPGRSTLRNDHKAGSAIPLHFSINRPGGPLLDLSVIDPASGVSCSGGATGSLAAFSGDGSGVTINQQSYRYLFKTPKQPPGTCTLTVALIDGTTHSRTFTMF